MTTTRLPARPGDHRVTALLAELDAITTDRAMATRFPNPGAWLTELATEERDVWDHLHEALTAHDVQCAPAHSENLTKPVPTWHARASRGATVRGNVR
jgi:hypothetical protein